MIRMSRVGAQFVENLADQNSFVRAVHVTGGEPQTAVHTIVV